MNVPFVDLHAQYLRYRTEIDAAIAGVIADTAFIGGERIKNFESNFSNYTEVAHTIACANGTDSLEMILDALGVQAGDEIIVPALSWISTAEVVGTRGATPVFVDIDKTYTIDPELIEERITPRTKGIMPVHLYGCPANMPRIMEIAEKHGLFVIEDCAQAHGARVKQQNIATFGVAASFSFYPGKNLGAYGDAGAVVTDHIELADHIRMIANHGQPKKHDHQIEGRNSRLDTLQAAILNAKLPYLPLWTAERQRNAARYNTLLQASGLTLPFTPEEREHVYHLYVVQTESRTAFMKHLNDHNVGHAVHYPTPMPLMPCYAKFKHASADFPVAAAACARIVSLPMYAELSEEQQQYVADVIQRFNG